MTRADQLVVGVLVLLLAIIAGAVGAPAFAPALAPSANPTFVPIVARPYREGVLGRATSVNPLTAVTRADHDLVALVFSGLVALGPGEAIVPGLASDWSVDSAGKVWTFRIRDDARWQDGVPVTADDVVFTVGVLQDPSYGGPGAASWRDVTARATGQRTVTFELSTPIGGFLQAATQPIVPAHLLRGIPISQLGDDAFGRAPIGTGPFQLVTLDDQHAVLKPARYDPVAPDQPGRSAAPTRTLAPAGSTPRSGRPMPFLSGIEMRFFDDPGALAAAYEAGDVDAAAGLPPQEATRLAGEPGSRLLRYPTSRLTVVVLNLRKSRPEFRDPKVRVALLEAIDRDAIVKDAFGGGAVRADAPIPPGSWAFDRAASPRLPYDQVATRKALLAAGWKAVTGGLARPGDKTPLAFDLLSPDAISNPVTFAAARRIAADWRRLGLKVSQVGLSAADLVGQRLRTGGFAAAVVDVNVGLDPDLYPLLASTQTTSNGINFSGLQDLALDKLLVAARGPGSDEARRAAYAVLQKALATGQYILPIAFRDELVVARDSLSGPAIRPIGDPADRFWDVLTWRLAVDR